MHELFKTNRRHLLANTYVTSMIVLTICAVDACLRSSSAGLGAHRRLLRALCDSARASPHLPGLWLPSEP